MIERKKISAGIAIIIRHSVLISVALIIVFPFLWMIISSFKGPDEIFADTFKIFPKEWMFSNYPDAMHRAPFGRFFLNTLIVSAIALVAQLFTCSCAAYAFAKLDFFGKRTLFIIVLSSMIIPFETTIIPNFILARTLGLMDTHLGIAMVSLTSVFGIFLMRQFFMTIPDDLLHAARIDGCKDWGIFIHVIIPSSGSVFATTAIFSFLGSWNGYIWPLIVTNNNDMRTIQVGLKYLVHPDLGPEWPIIMAASSIIILPVLLLFIFMQQYFVEGITRTGLK